MSDTAASGPGRRGARRIGWDLAILVGLLLLAALLRLPDLATRGTWDADQGHDMLVLRSFVRDGVVPLLGPPTSIGDFHHGAWYYYLLAPAAIVTGGDSPLAVVTAIALSGVAAVGVTWWLARSVAASSAGPLAGTLAGSAAGLVMAVSSAAIEESTFIWNPNLIALSSAVALAGAWRAWSTRRSAWWVVAAVGTAITMQCHVLGVTLLPIVAALLVADWRRRPDPAERAAVIRGGLTAVALLLLAYVPLAIHELANDFSETRAALDYLTGDRESGAAALPIRFGVVGLRVVSWPLVGLITEAFAAAVLATAAVGAIIAWRGRSAGPDERLAVRWLGLGLLWSALFLAVASPSLASVVPGLPNDHYHAFADPAVFAIVGLGTAGLATASGAEAPTAGSWAGRAIAVIGVGALLAWNVRDLPPAVHPDGGFPAAASAAEGVDAALSDAGIGREEPVLLRSLPGFKSTEAMAYPLVRLGRSVFAETPAGLAPGSTTSGQDPEAAGAGLVLLCDDLFETAIGAPCGGEAEATVTPDAGGPRWGPLLRRSEVAPGRYVSVYGSTPDLP